MRVVTIVGARPQFIKVAPVSRALRDESITGKVDVADIIVHTGQHYDTEMSSIFFDELDIPRPTVHLSIGSGTHAVQTARMLEAIEKSLMDLAPDMVVVYGDTNSTLAGALAAAKLHFPIAHVEAGLRSFNRTMPEETNRVVTDHVSDLLLAPTATAMRNLEKENLQSRATLSGDVMLDAVKYNAQIAAQNSDVLERLNVESGNYAIATLHRPVNTDSDNLNVLLDTLCKIAREHVPIVFPVHPRTSMKIDPDERNSFASSNLILIEPVGYLDMLQLLSCARFGLTDSGGLQKEALFLGTPCITLREETEWPETVEAGGNILTGADPDRILDAVSYWMGSQGMAWIQGGTERSHAFGSGQAASEIAKNILNMV